MYDLIASWMTSGGPLQELDRDDHGGLRRAAERSPAQPQPAHRLTLPFTRWLHAEPRFAANTCSDQCPAR